MTVAPAVNGPAPGAGALAGLKVIEICSTVAGPACARLLADFGADAAILGRDLGMAAHVIEGLVASGAVRLAATKEQA